MTTRLWSLWEMLRLYAEPFVAALRAIGQLEANLSYFLKDLTQEMSPYLIDAATLESWHSSALTLHDDCTKMSLATSAITAKKLVDALSGMKITKVQGKSAGNSSIEAI